MVRGEGTGIFRLVAEVVISLMLALMMALTLSTTLQAQGPALTTISDTVYRADGTAASGTVLISWPSFQTAEGDAVAGGDLAVTIGPGGGFSAQLVPNVGASPAGTYYVVVFQLDDGTVRTEYWVGPGDIADDDCRGAGDPGHGAGKPCRDAGVRERVGGKPSARHCGGAPGRDGDDHGHEAVCGASGASGACRRQ